LPIFDIALGVVEIVPSGRIDPAHRADHLAAEQDVLRVDHLGEQVDARLMIDAGVEIDVVHQVRVEARLLQHVCKSAVAAPMEWHRTAAMRYDESQTRETSEKVPLEQLHE